MNLPTRPVLSRRTLLRAGAAAVALPWLEAMEPRARAAEGASSPRRLVVLCNVLGFHPRDFFPPEGVTDPGASPHLGLLAGHRDRFTVFRGFAHPGNESAGHNSEVTFLTAAANPERPGFRNGQSLDQRVAEAVGDATRFPSLEMTSAPCRARSLAVTRTGANLPGATSPSAVFRRQFLRGSGDEVAEERARLAEGRSVLDGLRSRVRELERGLGSADRGRLDEYLTGVRELERRLSALDAWSGRPKPSVDAAPPRDVEDPADHIARITAWIDLVPLALQTDSTRVATLLMGYCDLAMPLPGVTMGHHHLSHHGQVPEKLAQLRTVEAAQFRAFGRLLAALRSRDEAGVPLLDRTAVLLGSNLGNANSHSTRDLPILLAGGGFRHGRVVDVRRRPAAGTNPDAVAPTPLGNLFVELARWMGVETDRFAGSDGPVPGWER